MRHLENVQVCFLSLIGGSFRSNRTHIHEGRSVKKAASDASQISHIYFDRARVKPKKPI